MGVFRHIDKCGIAAIAGLSFFWPLFRRSYFGFLFAARNGFSPLDQQMYLAVLVVMLLEALCVLIARVEVLAIAKRARLLVCLGVLASALTAVFLLFSNEGAQTPIALLVGAVVLLPSVMVLLTLFWGELLLRMPQKESALCLGVSFALSYVPTLVEYLPEPFCFLLLVCSPALSACFARMTQKLEDASADDGQKAGEPVAADAAIFQPGTILHGMPLILLVVVLAFGLAGSTIRAFLFTGSVSYVTSTESFMPNILSMSIALALALSYVKGTRGFGYFVKAFLVLAVLFFTGIVAVVLTQYFDKGSGRAILLATCFCLFLFMWFVVMHYAHQAQVSPTPALVVFFLVPEIVLSMLSYYLVPWFMDAMSIEYGADSVVVTSLVVTLALIATAFAVLIRLMANERFESGDRRIQQPTVDASPAGVKPVASEQHDEIADISQRYGLSARETDVLRLLARGDSAKSIAGELFVSTATVQTHVKSIYQKMDIHRKQELIDFVRNWTVGK